MFGKVTLRWILAAIVVALGSASVLCEVRLLWAETEVLESHQSRWDCWHAECVKVARCREIWKPGQVDADYCEEAVAACAVAGMQMHVQEAEAAHDIWRKRATTLRPVLLLIAVGFIVWFVLSGSATRLLRRVTQ